jgi:hypothetical protein
MDQQRQRIAVAKACKWRWGKHEGADFYWLDSPGGAHFEAVTQHVSLENFILKHIPYYLSDLNAVREAIQSQPIEVRTAMRAEVWRLSEQMDVLPPAPVFVEAFLRVLDLWDFPA